LSIFAYNGLRWEMAKKKKKKVEKTVSEIIHKAVMKGFSIKVVK
jgi:hypothetical protein